MKSLIIIGVVLSLANLHAQLIILGARYGKGSQSIDVTQTLQGEIQNDSLSISASSGNFGGDPAPGVVKELVVLYRSSAGTFKCAINEGSFLSLSSSSNSGQPVQSFKTVDRVKSQIKAPKGSAFLKVKKSIFTDTGVIGVPGGTKVKIVKPGNDTTDVSYEGNSLTVDSSELTDDLSQADQDKRVLSNAEIIAQELATPATSQISPAFSQSPNAQQIIQSQQPSAIDDLRRQKSLLELQLKNVRYQMGNREPGGRRQSTVSSDLLLMQKSLEDQIFALGQRIEQMQIVGR